MEDEFDYENEIEFGRHCKESLDFTFGPKEKKPYVWMIRWDELGSLIERLTVYLHLPSGVKQGQYKVEVVDEGATREMQIDWLESMTNSALMFRKWSRQPKNHENFAPLSHVEFLAMEKELQKLRSNVSENVCSTSRISMPFTWLYRKMSNSS